MTVRPRLTNRWILRRRPEGRLTPENFEMEQRSLHPPEAGQVVLRVDYLAMDPAIRGFMNDSGGYAAPIAEGQPIRGMVLGTVIESRAGDVETGDVLWGFGHWADYLVLDPLNLHRVSRGQCAHPDLLHRRGTIGLTAYYGLTRIAGLREGDRVLISGSAGAVGSLAGQMARRLGASCVAGIAGGQRKCTLAVERYGYDACIDYKAEPDLAAALSRQLPEGIDVYFDNVGGDALAAAVDMLRQNARIAVCGMISGYDGEAAQGRAPNLWSLVVQTAGIRGFRVTDVLRDEAFLSQACADIDRWIEAGDLNGDFDIRQGLDQAPAAFLSLFTGGNSGRLLVRVSGEES